MASGQTNFNDVEEQDVFPTKKLLPQGKEYAFELIAIHEEKTTKHGDPMIVIKLECIGGIDNPEEYNHVFDNIVIPSPNSKGYGIAGRTKRFLHAIDEPYQGNFSWDSDNWITKKCIAKIKNEIYNDKPRNKIAGYLLSKEELNLIPKMTDGIMDNGLMNTDNSNPKNNSDDLPF